MTAFQTTEQGLRSAMQTNPDDRAIPMIYADLLDEKGLDETARIWRAVWRCERYTLAAVESVAKTILAEMTIAAVGKHRQSAAEILPCTRRWLSLGRYRDVIDSNPLLSVVWKHFVFGKASHVAEQWCLEKAAELAAEIAAK